MCPLFVMSQTKCHLCPNPTSAWTNDVYEPGSGRNRNPGDGWVHIIRNRVSWEVDAVVTRSCPGLLLRSSRNAHEFKVQPRLLYGVPSAWFSNATVRCGGLEPTGWLRMRFFHSLWKAFVFVWIRPFSQCSMQQRQVHIRLESVPTPEGEGVRLKRIVDVNPARCFNLFASLWYITYHFHARMSHK